MTISALPTESFNPTLCVYLEDCGDWYNFTLKEAVEELLIYDCILVKKKNLEKVQKKYGKPYEVKNVDLYELLNHEFIQEAPAEWWAWFKTQY